MSKSEIQSYFQILSKRERQKPGREIMEEVWLRSGLHNSYITQKYYTDPDSVIQVLGTNAKGSICACLEKIFRDQGEKVALFTSPHLVEVNERIQINGDTISDEDLWRLISKWRMLIDSMSLSHFEALLLIAIDYFNENEVDRYIIEAGVGGMHDATSSLLRGICVYGTLGLDHQNLLGNTLDKISEQKLGAISSDVRRVFLPSMWTQHHHHIQNLSGTQIHHITEPRVRFYNNSWEFLVNDLWIKTSLRGSRGCFAANISLQVAQVLNLHFEDVIKSISEVVWPGRGETTDFNNRKIMLSGDHNLDGVISLGEIVKSEKLNVSSILFSLANSKDSNGIINNLYGIAQDLNYCELLFRPKPFKNLSFAESKIKNHGQYSDQVFINWVNEQSQSSLLLVTGSLHLVGYVKDTLKRYK